MIFMKDLEPLKLYKTPLILPYNEVKKTKGYMLYTLNTSLNSIVEIFNNTHKMIKNQSNSYRAYYYDYRKLNQASTVSTRIKKSKKTISDFKDTRLGDYQYIKSNSASVKTPLLLDNFTGDNIIYDLNPIFNTFKDNSKNINKMPIVDRLSFLFKTINQEVNEEVLLDKDNNYTKSIILINLDDYQALKKDNQYMFIDFFMLLLEKKPKLINLINDIKLPIVLYSSNGFFSIDCTTVTRTNLVMIKKFISKLSPSIDTDKALSDMVNDLMKEELVTKMGLTGETGDALIDKDSKVISDISAKVDIEEVQKDELDELVNGDEDLKQSLIKSVSKTNGVKNPQNQKRDQMLRENQLKVKIDNMTIEEILADKTIAPIVESKIENTPCINHNMKTVKFSNFDKTYMETTYKQDLTKVITSLTDKTINCNVISVDVQDTSDELTLKETYTIVYEDELRKRHTVKVALPKMIDNTFIYVNGNKKVINKQLFAKPVIKTGPDEVQICTNYNKVFVRRFGTKFNPNMEKFKKVMLNPMNYGITFIKGDNTKINESYITNLEYDEIARLYGKISIGKATFLFNSQELYELFDNKQVSSIDKQLIGYTGNGTSKQPIHYDNNNAEHVDLITLMMSYSTPEQQKEFNVLSSGKKYIHTKATIMAKDIPVIILISFFEGLSSVIRKFASPNVTYSDKKDNGDNFMYIKFADGYLCYPYSDMQACMLFNGLTEIDTRRFTMSQMDERETYLDIFDELFGSSYVSGALINYYDFMIDPITLDILKSLDYPTDLVSLIIFANNLLADNDYSYDIDLHLYRLRSNEIIPALLYKELSKCYSRYRATSNNPNPIKMSMDENAVIKELVMLPTVEDYNTLNPIVELSKTHLASMKGYVGMNLDRAYTEDKRSYHDSMLGIIGLSTDTGPNCGKMRHLTLEPKVTNVRGFLDINDNPDDLTDTNLFTPVELCTPLGATRDDPTRTAMATKQSGHIVPVANSAPVLITNGMDQMVHYHISNDFSVVAEEDGKFVEVNEVLGLVIIEYKSGTRRAIDIKPKVVKNGGGGFYLSNQLKTDYKQGQSFKKDEILAYESKFFKNQGKLGNRMVMGSLQKIAVLSSYATFEDSTLITKKMSRDMASDIVMTKRIVLGKNASVDFITKKGQLVENGDSLIKFENSYEDSDLNKMLSSVRDELKEEIINLGKTNITSKYAGVIEDINVYCACDLDELSPSLKKIVSASYKEAKDRKAFLDKYDSDKTNNSPYKMGVMLDKPMDKTATQYGKIKGEQVDDGVMIEFYIKYHDELAVGDKITMFTANKSTIGYVIPEGYEPYTIFRPYEEVGTFMAPSAIIQRNVPSVVLTSIVNKTLIELKRKLYEILTGEDYNEVMKREQERMTVKESIEFTQEDALMESAIDLIRDDEGYKTSRKYHKGDVIMPYIIESNLTKHIEYNHLNSNAIVEAGLIIADTDINPGDNIILSPIF